MKQVWKCDHCSQTDDESDKILKHESKCSFNKVNKKCYTCKFSYDDVFSLMKRCVIGKSTFVGEDEGNCTGWVYEYLEEEREEKLRWSSKSRW